MQKEQADAEDKRASTGERKAKTVQTGVETVGKVTAQFRDKLAEVRSPDDYVRLLKAQYDHPILGPELERMSGPFMEAAARIPTDPAEFQGFVQKAGLGMEKFVQDQTTRANAKLSSDTQIATNAATNARVAKEGVLNRSVEMTKAGMVDARARQANNIAAGELPSGAPVLGVPVPAVAPWANQSNAKDANKVKASEQTRGAKEVEKDSEVAGKEAGVAAAAKRFLELNNKIKTGGVADKFSVGRAVQSLGSDYAELEAITAKLVPGMREPGSGATSDLDVRMFERATVGVDKPKEANEAIATGLIARANNAQDYALFRQTYLEQNGTLQGSDRYWKGYVDKNPIFDPTSKTPKINSARKSWREHFAGSSGGAPDSSAKPAAQSAPSVAPKVIDFSALPNR